MKRLLEQSGRSVWALAVVMMGLGWGVVPGQAASREVNNLVSQGNGLYLARDFVGARGKYLEAIANDSSYAVAYSDLGLACARLGDFEGAISNLQQAIFLEGTNKAHFLNLGKAYAMQGRYDEAITNFTAAVALAPGYKEAFYNRAWCYDALSNYPLAITNYQQAIDLDGSYAKALVGMGISKARNSQAGEAVWWCKKAIQVSTNTVRDSQINALARQDLRTLRGPDFEFEQPGSGVTFTSALSSLERERISEATNGFGQLALVETNSALAHYMYARALAVSDPTRSQSEYQTALSLLPEATFASAPPNRPLFLDFYSDGLTPATNRLFPAAYDAIVKSPPYFAMDLAGITNGGSNSRSYDLASTNSLNIAGLIYGGGYSNLLVPNQPLKISLPDLLRALELAEFSLLAAPDSYPYNFALLNPTGFYGGEGATFSATLSNASTNISITKSSASSTTGDEVFEFTPGPLLPDLQVACYFTINWTSSYASGSFVLRAGSPDLVVARVDGPVGAVSGTSIFITNAVANVGSSQLDYLSNPDVLVRFYISTDLSGPTDDVLIGSRTIDQSLFVPGYTNIDVTSVSVPGNLAAGTYYIRALISYNNALELTTTNNSITGSAIAITVGPDLAVAEASAPATASTGASILLTNTVGNVGSGRLDYFVGTSSSGSGYSDVTGIVTALVTNNQLNFVANNSTLGGDPASGIVKTLQITCLLGGVNQTLTFAENSAVTVGATGQTLTILKAFYGVPSSFPGSDVEVDFYLTSTPGGGTNDLHIGKRTVSRTDFTPGFTNIDATSLYISNSITPGNYHVRVVISYNGVPEVTTNNNVLFTGPIAIGIGPDLAVTQLTVPAAAVKGANLAVTNVIGNVGTGVLEGNSWVNVHGWLSTNSVLDTNAIDLGTQAAVQANQFGPGVAVTSVNGFYVPGSVPPGSYYFTLGIEYPTPEVTTANNLLAAGPVAINLGLALSGLVTPNPGVALGSLTYTFTVTNRGPSEARQVSVTDPLPPDFVFVSAQASQGNAGCVGGTVTWNLGDLASGAMATATVVVKPTIEGAFVNSASVSAFSATPSIEVTASVATTVLQSPAGPILRISRAGTNVVLSWSTNAALFHLESKTALVSDTPWSVVLKIPVISGDRFYVTNAAEASASYYRLSQTFPAISCLTAPESLSAWWPGQGNAEDIAGGNSGTLVGGVTFTSAEVGQGFAFGANSACVSLPNNLFPFPTSGTTNQPFTFEVWFKTASGGVILGQQNGPPYGSVNSYVPGLYVGTDGKLRAELFWSGSVNPLTSATTVTDNTFHHTAVSYDGTNSILYLDGVGIATNAQNQTAYASTYYYQFGTGYTLGWPGGNGGWYQFDGVIDEPALYSGALASDEIAAIYLAWSYGKCEAGAPKILNQPRSQLITLTSNAAFSVYAVGEHPLSYQWHKDGVILTDGGNITGSTNAQLAVGGISWSDAGAYAVTVSNALGLVTSTGAVLTVSIVQNLGFETPSLGGGYQHNPPGAIWAFANSSGISGNGSGFTSGNPNAPEGMQVAFLQNAGSSISQSLILVGGSYQVVFSAAQRANYAQAGQTFNVTLDGQVIGSFAPPQSAISYVDYATPVFAVTNGNHTLAFVGTDINGGDNTIFIDNVRVAVALRLELCDAGLSTNGSFQLSVYGEIGQAYTLQASTNLADWDPLLDFRCMNWPTFVPDPAAKDYLRRFYRVRVQR